MKTILVASLAFLAIPLPLGAVVIDQLQTFDDPTSGWVTGAGPVIGTPTNVPLESSGGPAGAGDSFMRMQSTGGSGPGSRLSAQNFGLWSGDYIAAGIDQIRMDVRNFGPNDLYLRLLFLEFDAAMAPLSGAFSTNAIFLPGGGDWETINFDITTSALTALSGLPVTSPLSTLSNTGELRIFHNPDPFFIPSQNPPIAAALGVDNITAAGATVSVSDTTRTSALLALGLLVTGFMRRRLRSS